MSHHTHDHHSHQESGKELSFEEKAEKLLRHWLHHNEEHSRSYQKWSDDFRARRFGELADLLDHVVGLTQEINHTLNRAAALLAPRDNLKVGGKERNLT